MPSLTEMKCVNCAKDISVEANVCPWCHTETSQSKLEHGKTTSTGFIVAIAIMGLGLLLMALEK